MADLKSNKNIPKVFGIVEMQRMGVWEADEEISYEQRSID